MTKLIRRSIGRRRRCTSASGPCGSGRGTRGPRWRSLATSTASLGRSCSSPCRYARVLDSKMNTRIVRLRQMCVCTSARFFTSISFGGRLCSCPESCTASCTAICKDRAQVVHETNAAQPTDDVGVAKVFLSKDCLERITKYIWNGVIHNWNDLLSK